MRVLSKHDPLEKGMANHISILCLENPMNSMKRQKYIHTQKKEMATVNIESLDISELKWTGMGKFNWNIIFTIVGKNPLEEME